MINIENVFNASKITIDDDVLKCQIKLPISSITPIEIFAHGSPDGICKKAIILPNVSNEGEVVEVSWDKEEGDFSVQQEDGKCLVILGEGSASAPDCQD